MAQHKAARPRFSFELPCNFYARNNIEKIEPAFQAFAKPHGHACLIAKIDNMQRAVGR